MNESAVHALIIFSEKTGFGHSITCNIFFLYWKNIFTLWFIGNSYPADGQLLCATVDVENAT